MIRRYLLDTSIVIDVLKRRPVEVLATFNAYASRMAISSITLAEKQLAATLGVGQDTISRLQKRSDMLLSTLRHSVESMGDQLTPVGQFPNRPTVVIERPGAQQAVLPSKAGSRRARAAARRDSYASLSLSTHEDQ